MTSCYSLEQKLQEFEQAIASPRKRIHTTPKIDLSSQLECCNSINNFLPEDVLATCWSWLDVPDLFCRIASTSQKWLDILKTNSLAWESCSLVFYYSSPKSYYKHQNRTNRLKIDQAIKSSLLRLIPRASFNKIPHSRILELLKVLPNLKELRCNSINEPIMNKITRLFHLEQFDVESTALDIVFKYPMPNLVHLTVDKTKYSDASVSLNLDQLPRLQTLSLTGRWTDAQVEQLFAVSDLNTNRISELHFAGCVRLTPNCLDTIRKYSATWKSLQFYHVKFSELTLTSIIENLLPFCDVNELVDFQYFSGFSSRVFGNHSIQLKTSHLQQLSKFTHLETLAISASEAHLLPIDEFQSLFQSFPSLSCVTLLGVFTPLHLYCLNVCKKLKKFHFIPTKSNRLFSPFKKTNCELVLRSLTDDDNYFYPIESMNNELQSIFSPLKRKYQRGSSSLIFFAWLESVFYQCGKQINKRGNISIEETKDDDSTTQQLKRIRTL